MARGRQKKVDLTYLGPAHVFVDRQSGKTWEVGQTHRISEKDVERIAKAVPQDSWSQVDAIGNPPEQPPEPEPVEKPEPTPGFEVGND